MAIDQKQARDQRRINRERKKALIERQTPQQIRRPRVPRPRRQQAGPAPATATVPAPALPASAYDWLRQPAARLLDSMQKSSTKVDDHASSKKNRCYDLYDYAQTSFEIPQFDDLLSRYRTRLEQIQPTKVESLRSINNEADTEYCCLAQVIVPTARIAMQCCDDANIRALGEMQLKPYLTTFNGYGWADAAFSVHRPGESTNGLPPRDCFYPLVVEVKDKGSLRSTIDRETWESTMKNVRRQIEKYLSHRDTSYAILTDYDCWYIIWPKHCFVVGRAEARRAVFYTFLQAFEAIRDELQRSLLPLELPQNHDVFQWVDTYLKPWIAEQGVLRRIVSRARAIIAPVPSSRQFARSPAEELSAPRRFSTRLRQSFVARQIPSSEGPSIERGMGAESSLTETHSLWFLGVAPLDRQLQGNDSATSESVFEISSLLPFEPLPMASDNDQQSDGMIAAVQDSSLPRPDTSSRHLSQDVLPNQPSSLYLPRELEVDSFTAMQFSLPSLDTSSRPMSQDVLPPQSSSLRGRDNDESTAAVQDPSPPRPSSSSRPMSSEALSQNPLTLRERLALQFPPHDMRTDRGLRYRPFPTELMNHLLSGADSPGGLWLPFDQIRVLSFEPVSRDREKRHYSHVIECAVPGHPTWPTLVLKTAEKAILDREVAAYHRLAELQGDIIPYFLGRYSLNDERYGCILLEKITESRPLLDICDSDETTLDYLRTHWPRFLSLIAYGVRHDDLMPRNVVHTANGPVIVDFGFATTSAWFEELPNPFSDRSELEAAGEDIETFMLAFDQYFEHTAPWFEALRDYRSKALVLFRHSIDQGLFARPKLETPQDDPGNH